MSTSSSPSFDIRALAVLAAHVQPSTAITAPYNLALADLTLIPPEEQLKMFRRAFKHGNVSRKAIVPKIDELLKCIRNAKSTARLDSTTFQSKLKAQLISILGESAVADTLIEVLVNAALNESTHAQLVSLLNEGKLIVSNDESQEAIAAMKTALDAANEVNNALLEWAETNAVAATPQLWASFVGSTRAGKTTLIGALISVIMSESHVKNRSVAPSKVDSKHSEPDTCVSYAILTAGCNMSGTFLDTRGAIDGASCRTALDIACGTKAVGSDGDDGAKKKLPTELSYYAGELFAAKVVVYVISATELFRLGQTEFDAVKANVNELLRLGGGKKAMFVLTHTRDRAAHQQNLAIGQARFDQLMEPVPDGQKMMLDAGEGSVMDETTRVELLRLLCMMLKLAHDGNVVTSPPTPKLLVRVRNAAWRVASKSSASVAAASKAAALSAAQSAQNPLSVVLVMLCALVWQFLSHFNIAITAVAPESLVSPNPFAA